MVVFAIDKPCAIVTDVRYRMSVPVIRCLGRRGIKVIAAERESTKPCAALGFYSKYTAGNLLYPAPDSDARGFFDALRRYASGCETPPVIIPVGMDSVLAISENREEVSKWARVAVSDIKSITLANDKSALLELAHGLGVPCPETTRLMQGEDIPNLAGRIKYPAVIKLISGELLGLSPQDRYRIVYDSREFISSYTKMHEVSEYPLVQEYIQGDGYGVSAVFDENHNPVSVFCHRRIREYPVSGGPSSFCVSVWNDELVKYAITILRALEWTGVAMVEFKGSPETGFKLMEINPRFWGSTALSVAAGCDIPFSLYRAALGDKAGVEIKQEYRLNKKVRFILQDLLSFSGYLRIKSNKAGFAAGFVRDLLNPRVSDGVLSLADFKVSYMYLKSALGKRDRIKDRGLL